jgi:hypothetical protein
MRRYSRNSHLKVTGRNFPWRGAGIEMVFVKLHRPERWIERPRTVSQGEYRQGKGGVHDEEDGKPPRLLEA